MDLHREDGVKEEDVRGEGQIKEEGLRGEGQVKEEDGGVPEGREGLEGPRSCCTDCPVRRILLNELLSADSELPNTNG